MKLQIYYLYQHHGDRDIVGTAYLTIDGRSFDWAEAKNRIDRALSDKYPSRVFEVTPISVTDVDDSPATWVMVLIMLATLFISGLVAAGICTVIMCLMR